jgi:hypothetical protein
MKIPLKEKVIVSSFTLVSTLTGYYYAKSENKDIMPYLMVGGFVGAILGEAIVHTFFNDENKNNNTNTKNPKQNGSSSNTNH